MLRQVPKTTDSVREVLTLWTPQSDAYRDLILDRFWTDFETNSGPILNPILDRFWIDFGINSGRIFDRF